ncbi:YgdI/YgdR family lipoprotein [Shewanella oneidensis]|nr:YgdI/YgdR family lipoprotein [Shewanella oneidensis]
MKTREEKMNKTILLLACLLGLVACSSQYIMSTKDGKMITSDSKPKLDKTTGMYLYYDEDGREVMIKQEDVTQIIER